MYAKETDKLYIIGILQVNHPPQKFLDKNAEKYQHEETDKPTKHHVYSKIITKCKFHIAHKPQNRNHSEKKMFQQTDITSRNQNIHIIPQKKHKNAKTVVSIWQQN